MFEIKNIEDLSDWENSGLDIWFYISNNLSPELALISSKIYFPKFIKHRDFYIVESKYNREEFENGYNDVVLNRKMTKIEFEKSWNNTKIYDVFSNASPPVPDSTFEQIGKVMEFSWKCSLKAQFPEVHFHVEYRHSQQEYGPIVTAWHEEFVDL